MCGLAGFARDVKHPGANLPISLAIAERLLVEMEHRGKHATGFAAVSAEKNAVTVFKKAVEPKVIVQSDPWKAALEALGPDTKQEGITRDP